MRRELTAEDLAARTGVPAARLDEWRARGLVGSEAGLSLDDVERVRLVHLFRRCGISEEVIVDSVRQGVLRGGFDWYLDQLFPGAGRPAFTLDEAADELGLARDLAQRLWRAVGKPGDILNTEDKEMLRMSKVLLDAGMPEEAQVQIARVCADALGRVAEAMSRALHFYVHEPTGRAGVTGPEVERAESAARSLIEPFVRYFYRLGRTRALPHDILLHLFEEAGMLPAP
ncbi:MAG: adenylate cyclase regulatory domain-containing protein, partial [Candidatus Binatia bacterium]